VTGRPPSLVAERAVRYLREAGEPVTSVRLAHEVLALRVGDENHAHRVLDAAFCGDPRLAYGDGAWRRLAPPVAETSGGPRVEPDIAFVMVEGTRAVPRSPLILSAVTAARRSGETIVAACGGELAAFAPGHELKGEMRSLLAGARVAVHAPPGGLAALEAWLEEPLDDPLPVALLGRRRLGLPAAHGVADLAGRLGLSIRVDDDPARRIEVLLDSFDALRGPDESWDGLMAACRRVGPALPWARYAFARDDLRALPAAPGTYRFYDLDGRLVYVGKSKNLRRRLCSWFQDGVPRSPRELAIVEAVHRFEIDATGSDLEALLREAAQIQTDLPQRNVQRNVRTHGSRARRLTSILILEPAEPPRVLRAWLIKDGRLIESIPLGPRGGGLKRVARVLDSEFFDPRPGPRIGRTTAVDVEIVARWLAEHRDRAVAFDPTHLRSVDEVVDRLKWFLDRGSLVEGDGAPILPRR
jgi:GIY-YIG catalytic domain